MVWCLLLLKLIVPKYGEPLLSSFSRETLPAASQILKHLLDGYVLLPKGKQRETGLDPKNQITTQYSKELLRRSVICNYQIHSFLQDCFQYFGLVTHLLFYPLTQSRSPKDSKLSLPAPHSMAARNKIFFKKTS